MDGLTELLTKLPGMVTGFAALGPAGWIAGGVLALLLGVGGFFLWRHIKKQKIEKARKETEANRDRAEQDIGRENRTVERDSRNAEVEIEDMINGGKKK